MRIVFEDGSFAYGRRPKGGPDAGGAGLGSSVGKDGRAPHTAAAPQGAPAPGWGGAADDPWALRHLSFSVEASELMGVAGKTGSGKSTLTGLAAGLDHPTCGRVTADGADFADRRAAARLRGRIAVLFQYPERQLFASTVAEDVAFGPRNLGFSEQEVSDRTAAALKRVGLPGEAVAAASPFDLSGGQQRRVALAGALAMGPEVLILDEPAAGLDPRSHREMLALVGELHAGGLTVVMVSHNMDDLAEVADRILVLDRGRQAMLGTPEEVFRDAAALKRVGLALPAAQGLACRLAADPKVPVALGRPLYDLDALAGDILSAWRARGGAGGDGAAGSAGEAVAKVKEGPHRA